VPDIVLIVSSGRNRPSNNDLVRLNPRAVGSSYIFLVSVGDTGGHVWLARGLSTVRLARFDQLEPFADDPLCRYAADFVAAAAAGNQGASSCFVSSPWLANALQKPATRPPWSTSRATASCSSRRRCCRTAPHSTAEDKRAARPSPLSSRRRRAAASRQARPATAPTWPTSPTCPCWLRSSAPPSSSCSSCAPCFGASSATVSLLSLGFKIRLNPSFIHSFFAYYNFT